MFRVKNAKKFLPVADDRHKGSRILPNWKLMSTYKRMYRGVNATQVRYATHGSSG
jgi:hypothetical protein